MKTNIKETASTGSISSHSIANTFSGGYDGSNSVGLKDFMRKFFASTKSRPKFEEVKVAPMPKSYKKIDEADDSLNNIFSQLRNSEQKSYDTKSSMTFGVEDGNGNIMKITVPSEQSEDFEVKLSKELAEIEDFKATGHRGKDMSMAELLYTLKDEFNVLDVDFPTIPNDVIYNADKATNNVDDFDDDEIMGDDSVGTDDELGGLSDGDIEDGIDDMDGENVEDFDDKIDDNNPESILASVMDMLKANAEAEKAKAEAEAEKARAKQAEYSAQSSKIEMEQQEELVRIEAEMEQQKNKEKDAKKMAEIARHKYNSSKSLGENFSFSPMFTEILHEFDEFDNLNSLRRQKTMLRQKFTAEPTDTPEERRYKQEQLRLATLEIQAKMRRVQSRNKFDATAKRQDDEQKGDETQNQEGDI